MSVEAPVTPLRGADILVEPVFDDETGLPALSATSLLATNLDGDIDVDSDDLQLLMNSYGNDTEAMSREMATPMAQTFCVGNEDFAPYTLEADFDFDAVAGASDVKIWENSYAINRGGDSDGDGDTDGFDFLVWQRETNLQRNPIIASASYVPEPDSMLLAWVVAFVLSLSKRTTHRHCPCAR